MAGRVTSAIAIGLAFNDLHSAGLLITQTTNQPYKAIKEMGLRPHFFCICSIAHLAGGVHVISMNFLNRLAVNHRVAIFG
jgi:hypothetical protein